MAVQASIPYHPFFQLLFQHLHQVFLFADIQPDRAKGNKLTFGLLTLIAHEILFHLPFKHLLQSASFRGRANFQTVVYSLPEGLFISLEVSNEPINQLL